MATISPADAEVALRTFPRRWRALLGGLDTDDPDTEALLRHRGAGGSSVLELTARAGAVLDRGARHIHQAVTNDRPVLEAGGEAGGDASLEAALRHVDLAAPALADAVARVATGDLDRKAERLGSTVTVRTLIADVVDDVAHLLRDATRALADARARR